MAPLGYIDLYKKKVEVLHPVNFVSLINGDFSMLSLNETAAPSKFIAGPKEELCFPIPL